jgi:hypothetical protein
LGIAHLTVFAGENGKEHTKKFQSSFLDKCLLLLGAFLKKSFSVERFFSFLQKNLHLFLNLTKGRNNSSADRLIVAKIRTILFSPAKGAAFDENF